MLAFEAGGGPSPGTAKTSVEGLAKGCRVRRDGVMTTVPLAYKDRTFSKDGAPRTAMTIPWGDVYTSYLSTGIPNVEVYMAVPPKTIESVRRMRLFKPFLGFGFVQDMLKKRTPQRGPSDDKRANTRSHIWGEVRNASGREAKLELDAQYSLLILGDGAKSVMQRMGRTTSDVVPSSSPSWARTVVLPTEPALPKRVASWK